MGAERLELDHEAVVRCLQRDLPLAAQQLGAHVRDDGALGADAWQVLREGRVVDMVLHDLVEEIRLEDEEVGIAAGRDQLLDPFGIA